MSAVDILLADLLPPECGDEATRAQIATTCFRLLRSQDLDPFTLRTLLAEAQARIATLEVDLASANERCREAITTGRAALTLQARTAATLDEACGALRLVRRILAGDASLGPVLGERLANLDLGDNDDA